MSTPYIGQVTMVGFNFPPVGWALCNGQLLSIANNNALYALIGTTYGGDGNSTFAVPDFRGRVPISQGQGTGLSNYTLGQLSGSEAVTVLSSQMPQHTHALVANNVTGTNDVPNSTSMPSKAVQASGGNSALLYTTVDGTVPVQPQAMLPQAIGVTGGSQAHENRAPMLAVNFIIALEGVFPTQN